ncbi:hypothetical protein [Cyclobacterium xiamenense]|uniref:hypothetical protein n=1 Tax=Cyclobacterium xiamenense TaxID=1297121 RepID=UPI0012B97A4F|nr:hypothetical protein [Cyclobacterium xiamenense]
MKQFTRNDWLLKNFLGFALSYSIYSLLAHGYTGGHDYELSFAQFLAHTVALIVVGSIVGVAQYSALSESYNLRSSKIIVVPLFFVAFFWIGYYLSGPPLDIILGFPVLGSVLWIFDEKIRKLTIPYKILAYCGFFCGALVGGMVLTLIDTQTGIIGKMQDSIGLHTIMWLILALPTAVIGGWISGISIKKSL